MLIKHIKTGELRYIDNHSTIPDPDEWEKTSYIKTDLKTQIEKLNFENIFYDAFTNKSFNLLSKKEQDRVYVIARTMFNRTLYELLNS